MLDAIDLLSDYDDGNGVKLRSYAQTTSPVGLFVLEIEQFL